MMMKKKKYILPDFEEIALDKNFTLQLESYNPDGEPSVW